MLSSEIVSQVRRLQLHTGRQVAEVLAGAYHSVFRGRGMEFEEVRPYVPGDDVRTIDWNVTARVGEPFVKRYVEERELTVMLLVDVSPSQDFGSSGRSKRETAVEMSALVAFSAIQNQDKVGLLLFHGSAEEYIPPRRGQKHALRVVREVLARGREDQPLSSRVSNPFDLPRELLRRFRKLVARTRSQPDRATNIALALEFCRRVLPRRVVLFLISDFIDEDYLSVLRHANRRHDVVCTLITDEREHDMPAAGLIRLEDAETGAARLVDTRSAAFRTAMASKAQGRVDDLAAELRASRVDSHQTRCNQAGAGPSGGVLSHARAEGPTMIRHAIGFFAVFGLIHGIAAGCGAGGSPDSSQQPDDAARVAEGPAIERTSENGPIKASVIVVPESPQLGDLIGLTLRVVAHDGVEVSMPVFGEALERFDLVTLPEQSSAREGTSTVYTQKYVLQATASGRWRVPPLRITYRDERADVADSTGNGEQELLTEEIPLVVAAFDAAAGAALRPAASSLDEEIGRQPLSWVWWAGVGAVALLAAIVLGVLLWRRHRHRGPSESAYQIACRRLDELEQRGLPEQADVDAWYVELSAIVRRYLEDHFALRAPELTTEEFLREAGQSERLSAEHRSLLASFLGTCDKVKFAAYQPGDSESQASLDAARRFLFETAVSTDEPSQAVGSERSQERAA